MLSDRDYMYNRDNRYGARGDDNPNRIIWILIAINAIILIIIPIGGPLYNLMTMTVSGIKNFQYWRLITSLFLHGGFWHMAFNMYGLYLFGTLVSPHTGTGRFLGLYFISGIFGNILWMLVNWNSHMVLTSSGYISIPLVGASGCLFGVMLAAAMLEPNRQFLMLFFPVPIKCKTLVIVYSILEIINELRMSPGDDIAHLAHLGGLLGGYIFLKASCNHLLRWDILDMFKGHGNRGFRPQPPPSGNQNNNTKNYSWDYRNPKNYEDKTYSADSSKPVSRKELDQILDKISYHGINSLTPEEHAMLKRAREQMKR